MKIISPGFELLDQIDAASVLASIERIGRVCYKSEGRMTEGSAAKFVKMIVRRGHESVLEHEKISVRITCDRGVSHEIVRHRLASYSQESTRYCNYAGDKFGNELTFIRPVFWQEGSEAYADWLKAMQAIEDTYNKMIAGGATPEQARCVLPNSLKTEIVATMNLRAWRHFFALRCSPQSHPQMREIAIPLLREMQEVLPAIFGDIMPEECCA